MPAFTAPDGLQLAFDAVEAPRPRSAVLLVHGWSDHAGRWLDTAERLKAAGHSVYLQDLRGHGRSGGRRGHLSRFSQLLGDLQAFRRQVRIRTDAPQVLLGHSFGGLVVLRYLETQPSDPVAAAIASSPFLGLGYAVNPLKLLAGRLLADLAPTVSLATGLDPEALSRDPAVGAQYRADPLVHHRMTAGAWKEIQWAQRAVAADAHRIDAPVQFLLTGEDRIVDAEMARAFADGLRGDVQVRWYPEMYHEALKDPQRDLVIADILTFLDRATQPPRTP
ncbi:MAG TPA: alpha/beta fold hydrolase [Gemmatimonadales bacterium]|nr:alpha/beta fold hydrolase [Gemmatimonadales bacterium]